MSIWHKEFTLDTLNDMCVGESAGHMGIEFVDNGEDFLVARMPVDHRTKQSHGILNGGASCLLAETVGSHASALCIDMDKQICVGLDINANHIRSVTEDYVYATCRPMHLGRSTHVWEIIIRDNQERTVCVSRLTMMIRDA
jgi:1,4-dihydroxy-2-naphthoyl-CoA hydrolase